MPDNPNEFLWWGFNALWLIVMGMVGWFVNEIRNELRELKNEIRADRRYSRWLVNVVMIMRTRCAMLHPQDAMPVMPEPPGEE